MRKLSKSFLLRRRGSSPLLARLMDVLLYGDALKEIMYSNIYFLVRRPRRNRLVPDFLVIGAQKAATTWLEEALRSHPNIRMPAGRKEVHYFTNGYWKGERWYLWHFRGGETLLKGEVTPRYSIIDEEWVHRAKDLNPDLKILFILRNPVERAWSMATMDLLRNPSRVVGDVSDDCFLSHFQSPGSIARGTYTRTIEKWRKVFGERQMFIGYYEEACEDPAAFLRTVFEFLKVDARQFDWNSPILGLRRNVGGYLLPEIFRKVLAEQYKEEIGNLHQLIDSKYTKEWLSSCERTVK